MTGLPRFLASALVCAALGVFCVSLHELGHVVAGTLHGGSAGAFTFAGSRPRVYLQGAFTRGQKAQQAAAGSILLIGVCLPAAALLPRRRRWTMAAGVLWFFAGIELLAWLIAACLYPHGPHNDVWKFLAFSGVRPPIVILICCCLAAPWWLVFRSVRQTSESR
ncbi:MAG: hypothetical protein IT158_05280 [Bryobacterales bacterium]|nr:hypothetical protein [Bryobacterales bacterium]